MPMHRGPTDQPVCHFTTYDVAQFFRISAPTARKWITRGLIKECFQLPGSNEWRVPAHQLLAFARERKLPTPQIMVDSASLYNATYSQDGSVLRKDMPRSTAPVAPVDNENYATKVIPVS